MPGSSIPLPLLVVVQFVFCPILALGFVPSCTLAVYSPFSPRSRGRDFPLDQVAVVGSSRFFPPLASATLRSQNSFYFCPFFKLSPLFVLVYSFFVSTPVFSFFRTIFPFSRSRLVFLLSSEASFFMYRAPPFEVPRRNSAFSYFSLTGSSFLRLYLSDYSQTA